MVTKATNSILIQCFSRWQASTDYPKAGCWKTQWKEKTSDQSLPSTSIVTPSELTVGISPQTYLKVGNLRVDLRFQGFAALGDECRESSIREIRREVTECLRGQWSCPRLQKMRLRRCSAEVLTCLTRWLEIIRLRRCHFRALYGCPCKRKFSSPVILSSGSGSSSFNESLLSDSRPSRYYPTLFKALLSGFGTCPL